MIKMEENTMVKDNTITINGVSFLVDDALAEQIYTSLKQHGELQTSKVAAPKQTYSAINHTNSGYTSPKKDYEGLKKVEYTLTKRTVGNDTFYCISRGVDTISKNGRHYLRNGGFTHNEKRCVNNAIKSLKGITELEIPKEDGEPFKTWGFKTKATAEKYMATLPTSFTAEEVNRK